MGVKATKNWKYPLCGYRLIRPLKEALDSELEVVWKLCNASRRNAKPLKKNDVFVEALRKGFEEIKRKEKRKQQREF